MTSGDAGVSTPLWVDDVVLRIIESYEIAAGPGGATVVRRKGEYRWRHVESIIGNFVAAEHRQAARDRYEPAIISRLRSRTPNRVPCATFHPMSQTGTVEQEGEVWQHVAEDGTATRIIGSSEACHLLLEPVLRSGAVRRLGVHPPAGIMAKRILGVLDDGDPAYPLGRYFTELVVPCSAGVGRKLVVLVETQGGLDVFGFGVNRPLDPRQKPDIVPLDERAFPARYFPMWREEKGKQKLRVLKVA